MDLVSYFLLTNISLFISLFLLILLLGKKDSFGAGANFAFFVFLFTPLLIYTFNIINDSGKDWINYIIYFIYTLWIISLIASIVSVLVFVFFLFFTK